MNHRLYQGIVYHNRLTPKIHNFSYKIFYYFIDLNEIDKLKKSLPFFCNFKRSDYFGDINFTIVEEIKKFIFNKTGQNHTGPIYMLTQIRIFGFCFNPVTFYYCVENKNNKIKYIVAQIENTPWKERFSYLIEGNSDKITTSNFAKEFHVSPFFNMDLNYFWSFTNPKDHIEIKMENIHQEKTIFKAGLKLKEVELSKKSILKINLKHPFITYKIVFGIYFQALKLWIKKIPFYEHPKHSPKNISIIKGDKL